MSIPSTTWQQWHCVNRRGQRGNGGAYNPSCNE